MKIVKGDKVKVIKGKDRGKESVVTRVLPGRARAIVEGVNVYKKNVKQRGNKPGGIIDVERSMPVANLMLLCPKTGKPTRVGFTGKPGKKVRISKVSGELLPSPGNKGK